MSDPASEMEMDSENKKRSQCNSDQIPCVPSDAANKSDQPDADSPSCWSTNDCTVTSTSKEISPSSCSDDLSFLKDANTSSGAGQKMSQDDAFSNYVIGVAEVKYDESDGKSWMEPCKLTVPNSWKHSAIAQKFSEKLLNSVTGSTCEYDMESDMEVDSPTASGSMEAVVGRLQDEENRAMETTKENALRFSEMELSSPCGKQHAPAGAQQFEENADKVDEGGMKISALSLLNMEVVSTSGQLQARIQFGENTVAEGTGEDPINPREVPRPVPIEAFIRKVGNTVKEDALRISKVELSSPSGKQHAPAGTQQFEENADKFDEGGIKISALSLLNMEVGSTSGQLQARTQFGENTVPEGTGKDPMEVPPLIEAATRTEGNTVKANIGDDGMETNASPVLKVDVDSPNTAVARTLQFGENGAAESAGEDVASPSPTELLPHNDGDKKLTRESKRGTKRENTGDYPESKRHKTESAERDRAEDGESMSLRSGKKILKRHAIPPLILTAKRRKWVISQNNKLRE